MIEDYQGLINSKEANNIKFDKIKKMMLKNKELFLNFNKETKSNVGIVIKKGYIDYIAIYHRYTNKDIKNNNMEMLKIILKNLLSPITSFEEYKKYYQNQEREFAALETIKIKKMLEFFLQKKIYEDNFKFIYEKEYIYESEIIKYNSKQKKIYYSQSIFQPSFDLLTTISHFNIIRSVEIKIIGNQDENSRNERYMNILKSGNINRDINRDSNSSEVTKKLLKDFDEKIEKDYIINVEILFDMNKELTWQEEATFVNYLLKNGIHVKNTPEETPSSIRTFDLINMLYGVKKLDNG
jgi:hypothetical protein